MNTVAPSPDQNSATSSARRRWFSNPQGRFVVLIDKSGYLVFGYKHCDHCLTRRHGERTLYLHQVLEAKLLGPAGTVFSIATEFIDNRDAQDTPAGAGAERRKQDCELKALRRLAAGLRAASPQLPICLSGDGLYACGEGFQVAKGEYVLFDKDELDAVKLESTRIIDIEKFVPRASIDRLYWETPYHLVPAGKTGIEAYAVIRAAMAKQNMVTIGRLG